MWCVYAFSKNEAVSQLKLSAHSARGRVYISIVIYIIIMFDVCV